MRFSHGWDDAGWEENDAPLRFDTEAEAEAEINEFIADTKSAVERGDMALGHSRADFRVVPA